MIQIYGSLLSEVHSSLIHIRQCYLCLYVLDKWIGPGACPAHPYLPYTKTRLSPWRRCGEDLEAVADTLHRHIFVLQHPRVSSQRIFVKLRISIC